MEKLGMKMTNCKWCEIEIINIGTADRNKSVDIEIPAYLLQIVPSKSPQQINRNIPRFI